MFIVVNRKTMAKCVTLIDKWGHDHEQYDCLKIGKTYKILSDSGQFIGVLDEKGRTNYVYPVELFVLS